MYNLCHRLSIVIAASTLMIVFGCPGFANPSNQSPRATNQVSPPPVEAILANVRIKPSMQLKTVRLKVQRQGATKLTRSNQTKVVVRQSKRKQPPGTASNLFNIDRVTNRYDNFTAVNRLIE
jgi:hypothetical protein